MGLSADNEQQKTRQTKGRRESQRKSEDGTKGLERFRSQSQTIGLDPNEAFDPDSQSGTSRLTQGNRKATPGGILSQLRRLRESHLAYAKSHRDRLKARLAESEAYIDEADKRFDQLEEELLSLLSPEDDDDEEDDEEGSMALLEGDDAAAEIPGGGENQPDGEEE